MALWFRNYLICITRLAIIITTHQFSQLSAERTRIEVNPVDTLASHFYHEDPKNEFYSFESRGSLETARMARNQSFNLLLLPVYRGDIRSYVHNLQYSWPGVQKRRSKRAVWQFITSSGHDKRKAENVLRDHWSRCNKIYYWHTGEKSFQNSQQQRGSHRHEIRRFNKVIF